MGVDAVPGVQISAELMAALLSQAVSQSLEQVTDLVELDVALSTGANPEDIGEIIDLYA